MSTEWAGVVKPRLLDLFSGAGGAARGYQLAGFWVCGVDIAPQPNYIGDDFCRGDALEALVDHDFVQSFDAIHASPPCQASTTMSNRWRGAGGLADERVNLIPPTQELLRRTGLPYVLENVPGARAYLDHPIVLTGEMFGLGVHRPRLFELNWPILVPERPRPNPDAIGVYGKSPDGRLLWRRADETEQRCASSLEEGRAAMGIDWMAWRELAESIPPAYTSYLGAALLAHVKARTAA